MRKLQWTKNVEIWRKYRLGSWLKSETKKRWSMKEGMQAKRCTLRHQWTSVISRIRIWNQIFKNTKSWVVLRGDTVEDDSGSSVVFSEQGSSALQRTAAKVMDVIARLPGCAGQAADAVSAYTQVRVEDTPSLLKIRKSECPGIRICLLKH